MGVKAEMFRPKLILGPVLALALVALAACADAPGRSSGAAVGGAPAASTTAPTTAPAGAPAAARAQSGLDRPDRGGIFSPTDNGQHSLRMCYQRCGAPTNQ